MNLICEKCADDKIDKRIGKAIWFEGICNKCDNLTMVTEINTN